MTSGTEFALSIFNSDMLLVLTFIITAVVSAFILGQQESKPRGSIIVVYGMAILFGLIVTGVVRVVQYLTENMAEATLIKVAVILVGIILIVLAGALGRRLNRK
jgi:flagellar biosynthesis protein FliQ